MNDEADHRSSIEPSLTGVQYLDDDEPDGLLPYSARSSPVLPPIAVLHISSTPSSVSLNRLDTDSVSEVKSTHRHVAVPPTTSIGSDDASGPALGLEGQVDSNEDEEIDQLLPSSPPPLLIATPSILVSERTALNEPDPGAPDVETGQRTEVTNATFKVPSTCDVCRSFPPSNGRAPCDFAITRLRQTGRRCSHCAGQRRTCNNRGLKELWHGHPIRKDKQCSIAVPTSWVYPLADELEWWRSSIAEHKSGERAPGPLLHYFELEAESYPCSPRSPSLMPSPMPQSDSEINTTTATDTFGFNREISTAFDADDSTVAYSLPLTPLYTRKTPLAPAHLSGRHSSKENTPPHAKKRKQGGIIENLPLQRYQSIRIPSPSPSPASRESLYRSRLSSPATKRYSIESSSVEPNPALLPQDMQRSAPPCDVTSPSRGRSAFSFLSDAPDSITSILSDARVPDASQSSVVELYFQANLLHFHALNALRNLCDLQSARNRLSELPSDPRSLFPRFTEHFAAKCHPITSTPGGSSNFPPSLQNHLFEALLAKLDCGSMTGMEGAVEYLHATIDSNDRIIMVPPPPLALENPPVDVALQGHIAYHTASTLRHLDEMQSARRRLQLLRESGHTLLESLARVSRLTENE
ncbi:hypothetical protein HGRIS_000473 [Hohenbuehelia grisea]|uniref:Uncharacterized protein n=1 Tax=Hohenbuehelia grisea TaxID=104357 RepID=A0ABR3JSR9_9AGAR